MNSHEQTASAKNSSAAPQLDVEREVRFAVVMYGGVSLAIYINGVTQELLTMVRATAPSKVGGEEALLAEDASELSGTASVYRKLGQYLDRHHDKLAKAATPGPDGKRPRPNKDKIRTRFIVDVISGTSAGGINGVFLGKALARNQKMDGLKKLWLTEGDLGKLLNDAQSVKDLSAYGFSVQEPQASLLNSQRMYRKLLEALEQMAEGKPDNPEPSPLVSELDLFITTTDIEGIPLPIDLEDDVVYERRYRNVFHFRYAPLPKLNKPITPDPFAHLEAKDRDDFTRSDDPFLAFAARCTSSFPFAFDAMCLNDIESVKDRYPRYAEYSTKNNNWERFYSEYTQLALYDIDKQARGEPATGLSITQDEAKKKLRDAFASRAFGDGGYLDNKPFSYATSMLMRRPAASVVDRKLLYIEPTPEHPEFVPPQLHRPRPDFAENVRAAVLELPRQETIREDIERIYERNGVLERTSTFAAHVDEDVMLTGKSMTPLELDDFRKEDLETMVGMYGVSYAPYHRLMVGEVTNLITELVARALGHDPSSDAAAVIRELVVTWRREHYGERKTGDTSETENAFLLDFDIRFALRRLSFLNRRITQLADVDDSGDISPNARKLLLLWMPHIGQVKHDQTKATTLEGWLKASEIPGDWNKEFIEELIRIKKEMISDAVTRARLAEEIFLTPESKPAKELAEAATTFNIPWKDMQQILSEDDEKTRAAEFSKVYNAHQKKLDGLAQIIKQYLKDRSFAQLSILKENDIDPTKGGTAARLCLDHYYRNFVLYDLVTYPVQYGTGAGEANIVKVFRVSPEDAKSIINERAPGEERRKLAGRALMSFGAFLDQRWRKNDMLWGRLDGAERLISVLLPDEKDKKIRQDLIDEAHVSILTEEIRRGDVDEISQLLSNALAHSEPASEQARNLRAFVESLVAGKDLAPAMDAALRQCLSQPEEIWNYYKRKFEVDRSLDPDNAVRLISRATAITGKMLEGLAEKYHSENGKRVGAWVARLGTTFWNMIAIAVPQSLGNILFRHWLGLLYLFSAVVIIAGIAFQSVSPLGWQLLAATVSLHVLTFLVGDFIGGKHRWLRAARRFGILLVAGLIGFGAYFVLDRSLKFFSDQDRASIIGVITGFVMLVLLGFVEWRHWLKNFLRSPTTSFSYRLLGGLTIAIAVLVGTLIVIGPADMIGFEFSRAASIADPFKAHVGVDRLRIQLGLDFALIVAYATMLASYCVAGAKLFWERRENLAYRFQQDRQAARAQARTESNPAPTDAKDPIAKGSLRLKLFYALLVVGFAFAGLQWLAAIADASENIGLLLYLKDTPPPNFNGLELAYWSATVKFWLIAAGAIYAAIAFSFGAWKKLGERPTTLKPTEVGLRIVFVAVSLVYFGFSAYALFVCRPSPQQCSPQLLPEIWTRLFH